MVFRSLFDKDFLAGFQHCSVGFSSGVYAGNLTSLKTFLWSLQNFLIFSPLCAGAPSTKRRTLFHLSRSLEENLMKSLFFFSFENMNTKLFLLRAAKTFVYLFSWCTRTVGLLPSFAQPLDTSGIKPNVASSSVATTNPFLR